MRNGNLKEKTIICFVEKLGTTLVVCKSNDEIAHSLSKQTNDAFIKNKWLERKSVISSLHLAPFRHRSTVFARQDKWRYKCDIKIIKTTACVFLFRHCYSFPFFKIRLKHRFVSRLYTATIISTFSILSPKCVSPLSYLVSYFIADIYLAFSFFDINSFVDRAPTLFLPYVSVAFLEKKSS